MLELGVESVTPSENYVQLDVIGNGAYGTVYKACQRANENNLVALKKIRVTLSSSGIPVSMLREISILKNIEHQGHRNVIRLLDVCLGRRLEKEQQIILFLVFEHIEQDLASYMRKVYPRGMPLSIAKDFTYQMLSGIDFLHSNRILHRDLKPQNLLITNDGILKVADFGLAKTYGFEMRLTSIVVTLWYRSPEVLLGCSYGTPLDIWSVGCIMAEMITGSPLFPGVSEGDQLDKIFSVIGTPVEREWPDISAIDRNNFEQYLPQDLRIVVPGLDRNGKFLLETLLEFDPLKRIGATEALAYPFFNDIRYNADEVEVVCKNNLQPVNIQSPTPRI